MSVSMLIPDNQKVIISGPGMVWNDCKVCNKFRTITMGDLRKKFKFGDFLLLSLYCPSCLAELRIEIKYD